MSHPSQHRRPSESSEKGGLWELIRENRLATVVVLALAAGGAGVALSRGNPDARTSGEKNAAISETKANTDSPVLSNHFPKTSAAKPSIPMAAE